MDENRLSGSYRDGLRTVVPLQGCVDVSLRFSRNEEIYGEGSEAHHWYRVVSGMVRSCNLLADGRRHVAEFFSSGDYFGFSADGQHLASAEAVGEVVLIRYPNASLKQLSQTNPSLAKHLHGIVEKKLAGSYARMVLLARMTAHERVASFLLNIADRNDGESPINLPMTRHDIADHLGLTFETVCRVISRMKSAGLISVFKDGHQIELIDTSTLEEMRTGMYAGFPQRDGHQAEGRLRVLA